MTDTGDAWYRTRLADLCPDHEMCTVCGAPLCKECKIGKSVQCVDDLSAHCQDCWQDCGPCNEEAARDFHDEQQDDIRRFGYA